MADGGKGSARRPGNISQDAWNRIFHPDICPVCGELKAKCGCCPTDDGPGQKEEAKEKRE